MAENNLFFVCDRADLPQTDEEDDSITFLPFPFMRLRSSNQTTLNPLDVVLSLGPNVTGGGKPQNHDVFLDAVEKCRGKCGLPTKFELKFQYENGDWFNDRRTQLKGLVVKLSDNCRARATVDGQDGQEVQDFDVEWRLEASASGTIFSLRTELGLSFVRSIARHLPFPTVFFVEDEKFRQVAETVKQKCVFFELSITAGQLGDSIVFCRVTGSDWVQLDFFPLKTELRALLSNTTYVFFIGHSAHEEERVAFLRDVFDATNVQWEDLPNGSRSTKILDDGAFVAVFYSLLHREVCRALRWTLRWCRGWSTIHYAGHGRENGDWVLHDDDLTLSDFCDALKDGMVQSNEMSTGVVNLRCCHGGRWTKESLEQELEHMYAAETSHFFARIRLDGVDGQVALTNDEGTNSVRGVQTMGIDLGANVKDPRLIVDSPRLLCFPAMNGECYLFVTKLRDDSTYGLLYDGGRQVRACAWPILSRCDRVDVVSSHVDNDHITGLLSIFRTVTESRHAPRIDTLFMNCPPEALKYWRNNAHNASDRQNRGLKDGNSLLSYTSSIRTRRAVLCSGVVVEPLIDKECLTVYVVSPKCDDEALSSMLSTWKAMHEETSEAPNERNFATGVSDNLITSSNAACICLLLLVGGDEQRSILLTGDAPKNSILAGLHLLEKAGVIKQQNQHFYFDLVTVPHHGSSKNADNVFFQQVKARKFVVSGNGRSFNGTRLPESQTLQCLKDENPKSHVLFNYAWNATSQGQRHMEELIRLFAGDDRSIINTLEDDNNVATFDCGTGNLAVCSMSEVP
eukprot:CAMPEP_0170751668 /NCGR_PEP_ID=MMETSP0437-20130122/11571_1 /TAXON_ID=0 /ORGANISM="Sexangularia sp." /LENGTH=796 /DNA_ID=CAMNT_0011090713 /DNA_START=36 /DNA_END=2426 /DNA_ORIENTATION=-